MRNITASLLPKPDAAIHRTRSVLTWPAWLRVLAVVPAVLVLLFAVARANLEAAPW